MKTFLLTIAGVAVMALLVFREVRFNRQMAAAREEQSAMAAQVAALHDQLQAMPAEIQAKLDKAQSDLEVAESRLNQIITRANELEQRLQAARSAQPSSRPLRSGPAVWQPTEAQPLAAPAEYLSVFPKRNHWGPEEVTGAPDTQGSGDIVTAWASARPDNGPEWLALAYDRPVDIAQVRIRETHNPGAIAKVTAFQANGTEVVLWEGQAQPSQAPNDFVVPVSQSISANQIKVYLDTQRVAGWNEIDAVELVGKDGSRQWASNASASSTYAEPQGARRLTELEFEPLAR